MENKSWKEKLDEVRGFGQPETDSAVTIDEKLTSDEIEEMLKEEFKELSESETPTESLEEKRDRLKEELELVEKELSDKKDSVEKTIEKLTERNMLGRLAKSLRLNESGKQKMFDYFEQGEL